MLRTIIRIGIPAGILLALFAIFAQASSHLGESIDGRVIKITDGNSLTMMLTDGTKLKVTLARIDAPEKNQPHYQTAKQALSDKAFTEDVRVEIESWKRSDHIIGTVVLDGEYLNLWMVTEGHAWAYSPDSEESSLMEAQIVAKANARGIWALSDIERVPPWEWRQGKRIGTRDYSVPARAYSCGSKSSCQEMTSCDEAEFYFRQCFLLRLDSDNDGVPCDSICD